MKTKLLYFGISYHFGDPVRFARFPRPLLQLMRTTVSCPAATFTEATVDSTNPRYTAHLAYATIVWSSPNRCSHNSTSDIILPSTLALLPTYPKRRKVVSTICRTLLCSHLMRNTTRPWRCYTNHTGLRCILDTVQGHRTLVFWRAFSWIQARIPI